MLYIHLIHSENRISLSINKAKLTMKVVKVTLNTFCRN